MFEIKLWRFTIYLLLILMILPTVILGIPTWYQSCLRSWFFFSSITYLLGLWLSINYSCANFISVSLLWWFGLSLYILLWNSLVSAIFSLYNAAILWYRLSNLLMVIRSRGCSTSAFCNTIFVFFLLFSSYSSSFLSTILLSLKSLLFCFSFVFASTQLKHSLFLKIYLFPFLSVHHGWLNHCVFEWEFPIMKAASSPHCKGF